MADHDKSGKNTRYHTGFMGKMRAPDPDSAHKTLRNPDLAPQDSKNDKAQPEPPTAGDEHCDDTANGPAQGYFLHDEAGPKRYIRSAKKKKSDQG